jgi:Ca2+-binding EF-hand superfamily protein
MFNVCVKFIFKLGRTISDTSEMLKQPFGEEAMSRTQIREWYKRLNAGPYSAEDNVSSGPPSTSTTEESIKQFRKRFQLFDHSLYRRGSLSFKSHLSLDSA